MTTSEPRAIETGGIGTSTTSHLNLSRTLEGAIAPPNPGNPETFHKINAAKRLKKRLGRTA